MGKYTIKPLVQVLAWIIASILVYLNVRLLVSEAVSFFETSDSTFWKAVIIAAGAIVTMLLIYIIVQPIVMKKGRKDNTALQSGTS